MKIPLTVTELWCVQECLEKNNKKGITWKLRRGEQSFLCATHHHDQIHIPIKLADDRYASSHIAHTRAFQKGPSIIF